MAQYKYEKYLTKLTGTTNAYDVLHKPGKVVSNSGIYRCEGCGDEIAANKGNPLPPQNNHQHQSTTVPIQWRLIVYSRSK